MWWRGVLRVVTVEPSCHQRDRAGFHGHRAERSLHQWRQPPVHVGRTWRRRKRAPSRLATKTLIFINS